MTESALDEGKVALLVDLYRRAVVYHDPCSTYDNRYRWSTHAERREAVNRLLAENRAMVAGQEARRDQVDAEMRDLMIKVAAPHDATGVAADDDDDWWLWSQGIET